ncbi:hypothetical protein WN71_005810 [Streptomyces mangrovisoli]|uniref:Uncharacterized protein n=1 Tax=Streptomyces mangrovisoli TaxID=1428628 RepID=A0A1J4P323_9ACTN|nr:hypothetical protein WN71_005810 [Streptomyces mangrovisoli]
MNHFSYRPIGPGDDRPRLPEPRPAEPGRWPMLEAALAVVNRDVTATLPGQEPLILMAVPSHEPTPQGGFDGEQVHVALPDGRWHGNQVNAYDPEEGDPEEPDDEETALSVVADAAQSTLMELLWQTWPICPEHKLGTHPRPAGSTEDWYETTTQADGPTVWWCRGDQDSHGHDLCRVGELAGTLPGKERRALRRAERARGERP